MPTADGKAALSSFHSEELVGHQCPFCAFWHMGHRKSNKRIEAEQEVKLYKFEHSERRPM